FKPGCIQKVLLPPRNLNSKTEVGIRHHLSSTADRRTESVPAAFFQSRICMLRIDARVNLPLTPNSESFSALSCRHAAPGPRQKAHCDTTWQRRNGGGSKQSAICGYPNANPVIFRAETRCFENDSGFF
ncbi:MAG: hypothetical protein ACREDQ_02965, partial [Limisphaerales bacterium]